MYKKNRAVLITGVTSGIGREIALRFASEGWDVVGHYCSSDKSAENLKSEIVAKYNTDIFLHKADFSAHKGMLKFLKAIEGYEISVLINNAGTYVSQTHFSDLTISDIEKTFAINVFSPMLISSKIFQNMKKGKFGRIVNISSIAAKYGGSAYSMPYGCSKSAMEGITKTLAKEGAKYNILVNTIRPGFIDTEFHKKFPKDTTKRIAMVPVKRMGAPKDIADMAYYLGSERNNFITDEIVTVAGGE